MSFHKYELDYNFKSNKNQLSANKQQRIISSFEKIEYQISLKVKIKNAQNFNFGRLKGH